MALLSQLYFFLLSDDKLAENNDDTYKKLLERHPAAIKKNRRPPPAPSPSDICLQVSEQEVKHAVNSFPSGSAGRSDGLCPQYIADL